MCTMSKILKYILCAFATLPFIACSGNLDDETVDGLIISADKTKISADGNDEVTFTVKFNGEDVSTSKTMQIIRVFNGEEKYMAYGANKFTTISAGTYKFKAKYYYQGNHMSENEIEIVAEQFFTGEEKNYKRRFFGTLFTSTGCTYCPVSAQGLKDLQAEHPGEISAIAFHSHFSQGLNDPMTIPATKEFNHALGGFAGLPNFFWNMRKDSELSGAANRILYENSFNTEKEAYQTFCGVAINTAYSESNSQLDIEVCITSNIPTAFHYIVALVEDKIPAKDDYQQTGINSKDYMHNNVARNVLTAATGDKLNDELPLNVGVEAKAKKSVTLDPSWNVENMRVIVAALTSEDSARTWTVNNVNECKVGESVPYLYAE